MVGDFNSRPEGSVLSLINQTEPASEGEQAIVSLVDGEILSELFSNNWTKHSKLYSHVHELNNKTKSAVSLQSAYSKYSNQRV